MFSLSLTLTGLGIAGVSTMVTFSIMSAAVGEGAAVP